MLEVIYEVGIPAIDLTSSPPICWLTALATLATFLALTLTEHIPKPFHFLFLFGM